VYPKFLLKDAKPSELELLRTARQTNDAMPGLAVRDLADALGSLAGRRILVMGLAYRANVKEMAFSSALPLIGLLKAAGSEVLLHDPLFRSDELDHLGATSIELDGDLPVDAVVLQAFHDQYKRLDWRRFKGLKVVLDGRAVLDPDVFRNLDVKYVSIGSRANGGDKVVTPVKH
jgi:UDP-N-acetyl-D-mannosaminuronate dehydrogenase